MTIQEFLPLFTLLTSFLAALIIFFLREEQVRARTFLNMAGATLKLVLVGVMLWGTFHGEMYETRFPLIARADLVLRADTLAMLFVFLSAFLWFLTTLYAIGYLEGSPNRSRFFGFFSLCVTATVGIAMAGNLLTLFLFYELLTLSTYPLVVHRGTPEALRAGSKYLIYTLSGAAVLLIGVAWLYVLGGPLEFTPGGALSHLEEEPLRPTLVIIFALLVGGMGVKAALVPLHGWLPAAMIAPAPVSALLHAVAVVKAGAFGIVRVIYDLYGIGLTHSLGVAAPLMVIAAISIVYGSTRALMQDDLKRRLAFSTVSQLSYITLGVSLIGPLASVGGVVHLVHQGIMKITLFFCAGNLAETLGIHRISDMGGVGRRMPLTMSAFTLAACGMIGLPPTAGFISKWYLGLGSLETNHGWVIGVLAISTLLNAAYFLPIIYAVWFKEPKTPWPSRDLRYRLETKWLLLLPPLATAFLVLLTGLTAALPVSPAGWVRIIVEEVYHLWTPIWGTP
jgi:multicomponent Na+:H+ antiporter subunit D